MKKLVENMNVACLVDVNDPNEEIWINAVGGLGDNLIFSGILKLCHDYFPEKKYNIVRRNRFMDFYRGHPAVKTIGFPPTEAKILGNLYWMDWEADVKAGGGLSRPFQILARKFGLPVPVEEKLFFPGEIQDDPILHNYIPWKEKNIVICPASDSHKKIMGKDRWNVVAERLADEKNLLIQVGREPQYYVKGAFSLIDLTDTFQLMSLINVCDLVITSDNMIMHMAHLFNKPAIVLWGPTLPEVYGYEEQIHLTPSGQCPQIDICISADATSDYHEPCEYAGKDHCMNRISLDRIVEYAQKLLG